MARAGLRAAMGCGFGRMNDVTIIQSSQGLAAYVRAQCPDAAKAGVVVGFDGRHNSARFALLTANVFLRQGVRVYLFSALCPTPFVVRRIAGVVELFLTVLVLTLLPHCRRLPCGA